MSVQYQREIFNNGALSLYINFFGISPENTTSKEDLTLSIFAIDRTTYKHIFSETLNCEQAIRLHTHLNNISIIRDGAQTSEFIEVTSDLKDILSIITTVDSTLVKAILEKVNEDKKLALVLEALTESEIQNLHASVEQANHKKSIKNLKQLLELEDTSSIVENIKQYENLSEYTAGQSEKIF